jgi:hypothetical protein
VGLSALALASALTLAACGGGGTPTPVGDALIDERTAERLLTKRDIEDTGADAGGLDQSVEDVRAVVAAISPVQVEHVATWHTVRFESPSDGPALILQVVEYDSIEPAIRMLDVSEAGIAFEPLDPPIGDRAIVSPPSADIGTAVTFLEGQRLVSLQVPLGNDGISLLDTAQLLALARLVADRL